MTPIDNLEDAADVECMDEGYGRITVTPWGGTKSNNGAPWWVPFAAILSILSLGFIGYAAIQSNPPPAPPQNAIQESGEHWQSTGAKLTKHSDRAASATFVDDTHTPAAVVFSYKEIEFRQITKAEAKKLRATQTIDSVFLQTGGVAAQYQEPSVLAAKGNGTAEILEIEKKARGPPPYTWPRSEQFEWAKKFNDEILHAPVPILKFLINGDISLRHHFTTNEDVVRSQLSFNGSGISRVRFVFTNGPRGPPLSDYRIVVYVVGDINTINFPETRGKSHLIVTTDNTAVKIKPPEGIDLSSGLRSANEHSGRKSEAIRLRVRPRIFVP